MLVITPIATFELKPEIATPKDVPDAGGCSVDVITIKKMERPTASEYTTREYKREECGIKEQRDPEKRPIKWLPITFFGLAVISFGIAKTMKALAPIDVIITACSMLKSKSVINIVRVARKLWNR